MADLGTILSTQGEAGHFLSLTGNFGAVTPLLGGKDSYRYIPNYLGGNGSIGANLKAVISGVTKKDLVIYPFKRCVLFYRKTMVYLGETISDSTGNFTFYNLPNSEVNAYQVICMTDEPFNALIFDKLTPV